MGLRVTTGVVFITGTSWRNEQSEIAAKIAELKAEIESMDWLQNVPLGGNDDHMHGISEHLGGS